MADGHLVNGGDGANAALNSADNANTPLQSNDTRNLLDIVDNLRSKGISRYIDLPEIIVCGEQSSGKSSVLEAISGVTFPSKDNLCTRFATELILRRGPVAPIKIRIVPGTNEERTEADKAKLLDFNHEISVGPEQLVLEEYIESAKTVMGIDDSVKVFSSDILRLEVSGPEQPHLTLVDLPGLFQAGSRAQSDADSETVKSLVQGYMRSPRSIILAVVSAKNDFNNQVITKYSRDIDPEGLRTLGLITKPDTLDEGSDSERFYVELAQNKDVKFRLGWHVLRNRDYATRHLTLHERNLAEEKFFASGVWKYLPPSQVGVHSLKSRLSRILKDQILVQLPDVLTQIQDGIQDCNRRLDILGASRATVQQQRRYLLHVSQRFSSLVKAASDGLYSDPFFEDASTEIGYCKRLRAVLQNILTDFAKAMRQEGHRYAIVEDGPAKHPRQITRQEYICKVRTLLQRSRGRELPGTFDPLIIGQLFREQSEPWAKLVNQTEKEVLQAVHFVVRSVLSHYSDRSTLDGLLKQFIYPRLEGLTKELRSKVDELLRPHDTGHPITYNHYLTENVQKAQEERRARDIKKSLDEFFGGDHKAGGVVTFLNVNLDNLFRLLVTKTEADMNDYASSTATDFMEAYYAVSLESIALRFNSSHTKQVALKKIIDDFSVLAVEACLIEKLPSLFCPEDVLDITDEMVAALAAEDEESSAERARCSEKLKVLEDGLRALSSVQGVPLARFYESTKLQDVALRTRQSTIVTDSSSMDGSVAQQDQSDAGGGAIAEPIPSVEPIREEDGAVEPLVSSAPVSLPPHYGSSSSRWGVKKKSKKGIKTKIPELPTGEYESPMEEKQEWV